MGQLGVFKVRYPKKERALLERYVPRMLGEAWGQMKVHYMFAPTTPVQVELYGERQHFSVRTSGLPSIGIQGVCFGRVVAAMSPDSEPFNWGNVLWHELGHVFAIQLSKNHVPRWFTEGLSEYETIIRRPEWQRELDPQLWTALEKNALPGAVDMNRAFTHANDDLDVTVAYYAASQMIVFTAEEFGMSKITRALELWGEGVRTPDVIQRAFGVPASEYDARYRAWERNRLAHYRGQFMFDAHAKPLEEAKAAAAANPTSAQAHVGLALSLARAHKLDEAQAEVDAALKIDPGEKTAHYLGAKLAGGRHDGDAQLRHLQAIQKAGGDGYTVQMALADVAEEKKDKATERAALEAASRFDPSQSEAIKGLYDLAKEEKRDADALDALRKLARLEQHDRRIWGLYLERLVETKQWAEAKRAGESAIYVDVEGFGTHLRYARALAATADHEKAAFELESALLCQAKPPELATAHALLARELVALGSASEAKKHLDQATKLDPNNAEAAGVKLP
jgi:tetratricopeptide (TPR) repeat protein